MKEEKSNYEYTSFDCGELIQSLLNRFEKYCPYFPQNNNLCSILEQVIEKEAQNYFKNWKNEKQKQFTSSQLKITTQKCIKRLIEEKRQMQRILQLKERERKQLMKQYHQDLDNYKQKNEALEKENKLLSKGTQSISKLQDENKKIKENLKSIEQMATNLKNQRDGWGQILSKNFQILKIQWEDNFKKITEKCTSSIQHIKVCHKQEIQENKQLQKKWREQSQSYKEKFEKSCKFLQKDSKVRKQDQQSNEKWFQIFQKFNKIDEYSPFINSDMIKLNLKTEVQEFIDKEKSLLQKHKSVFMSLKG